MFRRLWAVQAVLGVALLLAACGPNPAPPPPALSVSGRIYPRTVAVEVLRDDLPDSRAAVSVNETDIPMVSREGGYFWSQASGFTPGQGIRLQVLSGDLEVVGTGSFPYTPTIMAPADFSALSPADDVTVNWTTSLSPEGFWLYLTWPRGDGNFDELWFQLAGTERTRTIPAAALPVGVGIHVQLYAVSELRLAGDLAGTSFPPTVRLHADAPTVHLTR